MYVNVFKSILYERILKDENKTLQWRVYVNNLYYTVGASTRLIVDNCFPLKQPFKAYNK